MLTWQASTDYYGVAFYLIERCTGAGCTGFVQVPYGQTAALTFTDARAEPLTTYRYRVRAFDHVGLIGGYSNIATATTLDRPPLTGVKIKVGGTWTDVAAYARVAGATVTQALNEVVDTAAITVDGKIPYALKGTEITITDGAGVAHFSGHVTAVRTIYEGRARNVAYECDCCDYTWLLNSRKVTARYTAATIPAIVQALITGFAPAGFTVDVSGVTNNLTLDEITFTNEELAQAISRVSERGGAYWYADYGKVVRVFNSAAIPSAGTIDDAHPRTAVKLAQHDDAAATATRAIARGGGAPATSDAAVGQNDAPSTTRRRRRGRSDRRSAARNAHLHGIVRAGKRDRRSARSDHRPRCELLGPETVRHVSIC